jgi:nitrile hydratase alpha subunit
MSDDHDHAQDHPHIHRSPPRPDQDDTLTYYRAMEAAVRDLLIEKKILTAADVRRQVESMDGRNPSGGARMVARAWRDPEYRRRMLSDGHNLIVCTLCSCYPRMLLGLPPDWYKSRNYRSRVVREPRAVLGEFGTEIPSDVQIRVHDSTADMRYLVLPRRPEGTDALSEADLAKLVTRDSMIGVAVIDQN